MAVDDFAFAEAAGFEGGVAGVEFVGGDGFGDVDGEVAEIDGVPEDDGFDGTVEDVFFHVVRGGEAGDLNLADLAGLLDGFSSAGEGGGADRPHAFEIGMCLDEVLRDLESLGLVVVGRLDGDELEVGVFLKLFLHVLDPLVLVSGGHGGGDDGDFAGGFGSVTVADVLGESVDERVADLFGGGLVDEEFAGVFGGVGVPGDGVDALVAGGFHDGGEDGGIVGGDGDDVSALKRPLFDVFGGFVGLAADGTVVGEFDIAEFFGSFGCAVGGTW